MNFTDRYVPSNNQIVVIIVADEICRLSIRHIKLKPGRFTKHLGPVSGTLEYVSKAVREINNYEDLPILAIAMNV